jgi:hypothetical protein
VTPQQTILVAGSFGALDGDVSAPLGDGTGHGLLEVAADLSSVRGASAFPGGVRDIEVNRSDGSVVAVGDFGVVVLEADARTLRYHDDLGGVAATRVAVGQAGTVVALTASRQLFVSSAAGRTLALELTDALVEDVAVDDHVESIFVVGSKPGDCPGTMPFLRSYSLDGVERWRAYDHSEAGTWCASSRGVRVIIGEDGWLYYAGENHGGNTVHIRDPRDVDTAAELVSYDAYTMGAGRAVNRYGFVARFDPATGDLDSGQVVLPRDQTADKPFGTGGEFLISALAADGDGRVYVGGSVTCCIDDREALTIGGVPVGPYAGREPTLLVLSRALDERLTWTTFTASGSTDGTVESLAVRDRRIALVVQQQDPSGRLVTRSPLRAEPRGQSEGFIAVLPGP